MFRESRSRLSTWSLVLPIALDLAPPAISTCGSPRLDHGKKDGIKTGILPIFPSVPPWPAVTRGGCNCRPSEHRARSLVPTPDPSHGRLILSCSTHIFCCIPGYCGIIVPAIPTKTRGRRGSSSPCEPWSSPMAVHLVYKETRDRRRSCSLISSAQIQAPD